MSDTEVILYTERIKHEGEGAAARWLLDRKLHELHGWGCAALQRRVHDGRCQGK
jgi:hypothetical protein